MAKEVFSNLTPTHLSSFISSHLSLRDTVFSVTGLDTMVVTSYMQLFKLKLLELNKI